MDCDMCGKNCVLFKTQIEGSIINLCEKCAKFGKIIPEKKNKEIKKEINKEIRTEETTEEPISGIIPDYGIRIKEKREQLKLSQEDFAKKINEKISLLHKIETNQFEPNIGLAMKIEKFLHISLIEQKESELNQLIKQKSERFTVGDFIKIKNKQ